MIKRNSAQPPLTSERKWLMNNEAFRAVIKRDGRGSRPASRTYETRPITILEKTHSQLQKYSLHIEEVIDTTKYISLTLYSVAPEDRRRASRIGAEPRALGVRRESGDSARRLGADISSLSGPYVTRGLSVVDRTLSVCFAKYSI